MYVEVTTVSKVRSFNNVTKVVYHTNKGDVEFDDYGCIDYSGHRNSLTVYHDNGVSGLADQPFITKVRQ